MNRTQKLKKNSIASLINKLAVLISGLILPRIILGEYGSETNGLVSSISQFLSIITFLDLGVGKVVQAALYKPLNESDNNKINEVLSAAKKYFRIIAYILIIYVFILILCYPLIIGNQNYSFLGTSFLIVAMSISFFSRYYFGIINELLLNADQRSYIQLISESIVVVLNLFASIILIKLGFSIQVVKLFAGLIFLIRPLYLAYEVKRNYNIDSNVKYENDPLTQKWSGVGQHIAYSIQNSTDIIVLTFFSTLSIISIYSVYNMIANTLNLVMSSLISEVTSFFGNLIAKKNYDLLTEYYQKIEWLVHTCSTFIYSMTLVLLPSFVLIYTSNSNDINYYAPVFAFWLVMGKYFSTLKSFYQSLIFATGSFRQTQMSSFIEAGLNIVLSILFVMKFGLIGVAFGTTIANLYRNVYLSWYLSKNIIHRKMNLFLKHLSVDALTIGIAIFVSIYLNNRIEINNLGSWIILACIIGCLLLIIMILINFIFYRNVILSIIRKVVF